MILRRNQGIAAFHTFTWCAVGSDGIVIALVPQQMNLLWSADLSYLGW